MTLLGSGHLPKAPDRAEDRPTRTRRITAFTVLCFLYLGSCLGWILFGFVIAFDMSAAPDAASGRTYPITIGRRIFYHGYTHPWVGITYNWLFGLMLAGTAGIVLVGYVMGQRSKKRR